MTVVEAIALVEQLLKRGRLTKVQEIVFRQSWYGCKLRLQPTFLTFNTFF
ncbi:hypothetical protein F7734_00185 [Scytonema sp. UIC 10036]|nr:hypothetical protein [Scytonema sp. UIC 10036]MUG91006.1 hypothetical protein [Scytonema sp. UIC 10036]